MGIEPTYPAWKAGVLPLNYTRMKSGWQDSNLRPPGPKPGALAKLSHTPKDSIFVLRYITNTRIFNEHYFYNIHLMRHRGFEPRTTWLKVKCSTVWANIPYSILFFYKYWYDLSLTCHYQCPEPESNQRHEDFQSSALPTELSGHLNCGSWIWTNDLRVMSPTSFQTAPSRDILFFSFENWMEKDSNLRKRC